jgi:hypothetical protein
MMMMMMTLMMIMMTMMMMMVMTAADDGAGDPAERHGVTLAPRQPPHPPQRTVSQKNCFSSFFHSLWGRAGVHSSFS